jgi:alpha-L-fucosidase
MRELRKTVLSIVLLPATLLGASFCRGEKEPPPAVSKSSGEGLKNLRSAMFVGGQLDLRAMPPKELWKADLLKHPIHAFCIDFNWQVRGNDLWFAAPGHWAGADPAAHVKWYKDIGANCIQTFVLSCNGYAWYKGGPIPEQPGLRSDFLTDVVLLGHEQHMLVMGYYCIGANTLWGQRHPDQSYGTPSGMHIPLTKEYVAYLCTSVEDAVKKTNIDGFMLDWLANTSGKWLDCEKTMYAELMGVPFPGADKVSTADKATFDQRAVDRCWTRIRNVARKVKPDCILWPNGLHHMNLKGADWLLNEGPDVQATKTTAQQLAGKNIRLIQNQVGWPNHDARRVFSKPEYQTWDFYGFAAPYENSLPLPAAEYLNRPLDDFKGIDRMTINDRNIAALARLYTGRPVEPPPGTGLAAEKPAKASSVWGPGYEAGQAFDGDEATRWGAAPDSRNGWIEVDLGAEMAISRAVVMEVAYPRTTKFAVDYKDGNAWKTVVAGATIAGRRVYDFAPVKARYFRLNILDAIEVPTIEEFQLYAPSAKLPPSLMEEAKRTERLKWFHEAKFGLFINWGLYSIPAGEWKGKPIAGIGEWIMHEARIPVKEYEQLARQFNPTKFNAEEWVQLAEDAGMKYLVFDCKHHDGFALFHSQVSPYNCCDATPWKRDPFKELRQACDRHRIKLCFYYSQATDWHEPNGANNAWDFPENSRKDFDQYLHDKSLPQIKELLTNYGPIGLIWFDVPTLMTPERSRRMAEFVHTIQPAVLINSRLGPGGYHDYDSRGDNEIPPTITPGEWETAATINDTWGYKKSDHHWKPAADICFKLVDIVSKGGNYLLNVGPDGDGFIPQPSQNILRKVGAWLKVNGEAIYGAGRTPFGEELKGHAWRCTTKPGKLYVHFFERPKGAFELIGVNGQVSKAYLLADPDKKTLHFVQSSGTVSVKVPEITKDELATVVCIEVNEQQKGSTSGGRISSSWILRSHRAVTGFHVNFSSLSK